MNRRHFLAASAAATLAACQRTAAVATPKFEISLAQYSLHRRIWQEGGAEPLDPLDFPAVVRSFGLDAAEYVSMLWRERFLEQGMPFITEMRKRADDQGVQGILLMIDREGMLGDRDPAARARAVADHARYLEVAVALGCHTVRVDPKTSGETRSEAAELLADGVRQLCELAEPHRLNVLIENEAGFGADADWLVEVVQRIDHPLAGLLPDFGNFWTDLEKGELYDPAEGVAKMMPHSRAVSAKSYGFANGSHLTRDTREGRTLELDFDELMGIVASSGYTGHVGIEYEGEGPEMAGIARTLEVLREIAGT